MYVINVLQDHYNRIQNIKNTLKNIKDTDKDGLNDNLEIRSSDGQLKTNPDKDDITKAIKELEDMENQIEAKVKELENTQERYINRNLQVNRSKEISR